MNINFNKQNRETLGRTSLDGSLTSLITPRNRYLHQTPVEGVGYSSGSLMPFHLRSSTSPISYGFCNTTHSAYPVASPAPLSVAHKVKALEDDVLVMDDILLTSDVGRKVPMRKVDSLSGGSGNRNLSKNKESCKSLDDFRPNMENVNPQQLPHGQGQMQNSYASVVKINPEADISNAFTRMKPYHYSSSSIPGHQLLPGAASLSAHQEFIHPQQFINYPATRNEFKVQPSESYNRINSFTYFNSSVSAGTSVLASWTPTCIPKPNTKRTIVSPITEPEITISKFPPIVQTDLKAVSDFKTDADLTQKWSPIDDGIKISLPSPSENPPSRKDIDTFVQNVLYGTDKRTRLPVFSDVCLEDKFPTFG